MSKPKPEGGVSHLEVLDSKPVAPKAGLSGVATQASRKELATREKVSREQEAHLGATAERGFLLALNGKMKEAEALRGRLQNETSVRALRNGGVSLQEDEKNYLEKFERLAAAFLTPMANTVNQEGHLEYNVDFHGNELAEWNIGAGHCLPPSVTAIRVFDESGAELFHDSERGIKNGRVGYYEKSTGEYVAIHTEYRIEVLATADAAQDEAVQKQIAAEREFLERCEKDPTLTERTVTGRDYWANLLGDSREEIEPSLTKVEFLGRQFKVNRYVAPYLLEAGKRLADAGIQYHAETGGGYSFRRTWGRPAEVDTTVHELSLHSWGVAIDINPGQNPPHETGFTNISPEMVRIMRECGWAWGGNWQGDQYDPMHFQFAANPFEYTYALKSDSALASAQEFGLLQKQAVA